MTEEEYLDNSKQLGEQAILLHLSLVKKLSSYVESGNMEGMDVVSKVIQRLTTGVSK